MVSGIDNIGLLSSCVKLSLIRAELQGSASEHDGLDSDETYFQSTGWKNIFRLWRSALARFRKKAIAPNCQFCFFASCLAQSVCRITTINIIPKPSFDAAVAHSRIVRISIQVRPLPPMKSIASFVQFQQPCIDGYNHRACGHQHRTQCRREQHAPGIKRARGQRNGESIVARGPEKILDHFAVRSPG